MLNDYHRQFLRVLIARGVRFLLVGGLARHLQTGTATRDMDILIDVSPSFAAAIGLALQDWKREHPAHSVGTFQLPLSLELCRQVKFPDTPPGETCLYLNDEGEVSSIDSLDGIDILTSIKGSSFAELHERSVSWDFEGQELRMLCVNDLEATRLASPRR